MRLNVTGVVGHAAFVFTCQAGGRQRYQNVTVTHLARALQLGPRIGVVVSLTLKLISDSYWWIVTPLLPYYFCQLFIMAYTVWQTHAEPMCCATIFQIFHYLFFSGVADLYQSVLSNIDNDTSCVLSQPITNYSQTSVLIHKLSDKISFSLCVHLHLHDIPAGRKHRNTLIIHNNTHTHTHTHIQSLSLSRLIWYL